MQGGKAPQPCFTTSIPQSRWPDWGKLGGSRQAENGAQPFSHRSDFSSKLKASSQFYEKQRLCNHYIGACVRRH